MYLPSSVFLCIRPRRTSHSGRPPRVPSGSGRDKAPGDHDLDHEPPSVDNGHEPPSVDNGQITVLDQVDRYQEIGGTAGGSPFSAETQIHQPAGLFHHNQEQRPHNLHTSIPDARYSDVLDEAVQSAEAGVSDLKIVFNNPMTYYAYPPGGAPETSSRWPELPLPSGMLPSNGHLTTTCGGIHFMSEGFL